MKRIVTAASICAVSLIALGAAWAQAPKQAPNPAQQIRNNVADINRKALAMAKDFPEDKYGYKPNADVRSFGDVVIHIASGNIYGAKIARGEKANWDEVDPKTYKNKAAMVAALQQSIDDQNAALKKLPDDRFKETLQPYLSIIEHAGEHYGQLVVYYRLNGLVPPESRK